MPETERETPSRLVRITRSYSYKHNAGSYETRDFFCSQSAECHEDDAEATSQRVFAFCRRQVMADVKEYMDRQAELQAQRRTEPKVDGGGYG